MQDEYYTARMLKLAQRGRFTTHPNPSVGCVIVKNGEVAGGDYHRRADEPHVEVRTLHMTGGKAKGIITYVTLEPCDRYGCTPSCCDALTAAGMTRVATAMQDPNPRVTRRGLYRSQQASVDVNHGLMMNEIEQLDKDFLRRVRTSFPHIQLKLDTSLGGCAAIVSDESQ